MRADLCYLSCLTPIFTHRFSPIFDTDFDEA